MRCNFAQTCKRQKISALGQQVPYRLGEKPSTMPRLVRYLGSTPALGEAHPPGLRDTIMMVRTRGVILWRAPEELVHHKQCSRQPSTSALSLD